jgi:hypothetical protein
LLNERSSDIAQFDVKNENRRFADDLPAVSISRLRAAGTVTLAMATMTISLGDVEMNVGVNHLYFPNGGSWSFFIAPCCGRRARTLRLLDGAVLCSVCCKRRGACPRTWPLGLRQRAEHRIPKLRAMLQSDVPLRLKPHLRWSKLERRTRLEAALRKAELLVGYHDFVKPEEEERGFANEDP